MTGSTNLRFGLFLSQARKAWDRVLEEFVEAEELGFDHAWLVDHLVDTDGRPEDGCLEAWTLLAAIAAKHEAHPPWAFSCPATPSAIRRSC